VVGDEKKERRKKFLLIVFKKKKKKIKEEAGGGGGGGGGEGWAVRFCRIYLLTELVTKLHQYRRMCAVIHLAGQVGKLFLK